MYIINNFNTLRGFKIQLCFSKKYPTKEEFLNYLFMYHFTRDKKTLPICIQQFVDEVFTEYEDILKSIEPEEFSKRWNESVYKVVRIIIE